MDEEKNPPRDPKRDSVTSAETAAANRGRLGGSGECESHDLEREILGRFKGQYLT